VRAGGPSGLPPPPIPGRPVVTGQSRENLHRAVKAASVIYVAPIHQPAGRLAEPMPFNYGATLADHAAALMRMNIHDSSSAGFDWLARAERRQPVASGRQFVTSERAPLGGRASAPARRFGVSLSSRIALAVALVAVVFLIRRQPLC
jgi:hypothetical protein